MLELQHSNNEQARSLFASAQEIDAAHIPARILSASLEPSKSRRKLLESILRDLNSREVYTLCSIGNIYLESAHYEKNEKAKNEIVVKAQEFFEKSLKCEQGCFVAAIGMGICFVELKRLDDAKEVFSMVNAIGLKQSSINFGHCLVDKGEYEGAATVVNLIFSILK